MSSNISREIVRIHAQLYGRGPTKAKTYLEEDFALCILQDVFTPGDRTLIASGHAAQVQATRTAFQEAVEVQFTQVVEACTGRIVKAFFSQIHVGADIAAELFLFEDRGVVSRPDRGSMGAPPGASPPQAPKVDGHHAPSFDGHAPSSDGGPEPSSDGQPE
jgi:uncharacterized protein YbcI